MTDSVSANAKSARAPLAALRPFLPYAIRYRGRMFGAFIALLAASGATLTVPFGARAMIDKGFAGGDTGIVHAYFAAMIGVVALLAVASGSRYYLVMTLGERVVADLRGDVFAHLTTLDPSFYDAERTGEIVSRLSADATQLKATFGSSASIALRNFFMFVGAVVMMVGTSARLSAFVLIAIPFIVLPLYAAGKSVRDRSRQAQDTLADATAFAAENLSAIKVMQAFTAEVFISQRYRAAADGAYEAARKMTKARSLVTVAALFLAFASVVVVLWLGASAVIAGSMSGGVLIQFVLYAVLGASSLGEITQVWSDVSQAAGAASRIGELLEAKPRILAPPRPIMMPSPAQGELAFRNVWYAYPSRPNDLVLRGVDFTVKAGELVAIVGPSGSGKSTIFQLLERFYDVASGIVTVDGIDVRSVDPRALRGEIALVPQDPFVFGASIAENIAYGRRDVSRSEVKAAARRAAADLFIEALPESYDTELGERGVTLSGGERQRLAIARALLKNAPILLLDEATSALDAANETLVQDALAELMRGRTTLVIAHRLATVVKADRILVVDAGRIVEQGAHSELLAAGGLYARLARLQFETSAKAFSEGADASC